MKFVEVFGRRRLLYGGFGLLVWLCVDGMDKKRLEKVV